VDELRALVARYQGRLYDLASASRPDARLEEDEGTALALAQAHLSVASGLTAYHLHRHAPSFASQTTASLVQLAIDRGMDRTALIGALASWAPTDCHAARVCSSDERPLAVATWPDLALMVDGPVPEGLFAAVAKQLATADGSAEEAVERSMSRMREAAPEARGIGVLLMSAQVLGSVWGTVRTYPGQGALPSVIGHDGVTVLLSSVPLAALEPVPRSVHDDLERMPLSSLLAKLAKSLVQPQVPTAPFALAALRAGAVAVPRLPASPSEVARRRRTLLYIAAQTLEGRPGLSAVVHELPGETNSLFEEVPVMQVVIVRDDSDGAADETAVASELERILDADCFDSLRPFTVHGEYCK
jgi:hypothetical protein